MADITIQDVEKLARLSKIKLTNDDVIRYKSEIEKILSYIDQLNKIDTEGVVETSQVTGLTNATRKDIVSDYGVSRDQLLANSADSENGYLKVKRVL